MPVFRMPAFGLQACRYVLHEKNTPYGGPAEWKNTPYGGPRSEKNTPYGVYYLIEKQTHWQEWVLFFINQQHLCTTRSYCFV